MAVNAFDKADQYRLPAMILADGLLGQMMEPVTFPEIKPMEFDKSWAASGHKNKREHNIINSLFLTPEVLEETETDAEIYLCNDADIVVCAFGATARVAKSAVNLARGKGIKAGLFRPKTLWPFPVNELKDAVKTAKKILSVEMNMGQLIDDIKLATECKIPVSFFGRTGGVIPKPMEILDNIVDLGGDI